MTEIPIIDKSGAGWAASGHLKTGA